MCRHQLKAIGREAGISVFPGDDPCWVNWILQGSPKLQGAANGSMFSQNYSYSNNTYENKSLSSPQSTRKQTGAGRQLHRKPKIIANDKKAATLAPNLSNKKVSVCTVWLRIPSTLLSKRFTHSPLPVSLLCFLTDFPLVFFSYVLDLFEDRPRKEHQHLSCHFREGRRK